MPPTFAGATHSTLNRRLGFSGFRQEHIAKTLNAATPNTVNIPKARPITKIPSYPFHPALTSSLPGSSVSYIFSCVDSQSRDVRDPQLAKRTAVGAVSRPCEAGLSASDSDTNCAKHRTSNTRSFGPFSPPIAFWRSCETKRAGDHSPQVSSCFYEVGATPPPKL